MQSLSCAQSPRVARGRFLAEAPLQWRPMKEQPCWVDSSPAWTPATAEIPARVDVVVIGAGYSGLAAARSVARGGASVAVFDTQALGEGASARNGGQALAGLNRGASELIARYGRQRARVLFAASLEAISLLERVIADEGIACDCERVGHLQAAAKPSHFERFKTEQDVLAREFDHRVDLGASIAAGHGARRRRLSRRARRCAQSRHSPGQVPARPGPRGNRRRRAVCTSARG